MRKSNPQYRWHLTESEKKEIVRLTKEGLRVSALARRLELNPITVRKWRKAAGLPSKQLLPQAKIVQLLQDGVAPRPIARMLKLSYRNVTAFAWANGFGKPRKKLSDAELSRLEAGILKREASAAALSRKYRCSYKFALELAHKLLACERFLPSWRTPLSSYFPSRPTGTKIKTVADGAPVTSEQNTMNTPLVEACIRIVERVVECADGKMPADHAALVALILSRFAIPENISDELRAKLTLGQWREAQNAFALALANACDCIARQRNAQWRN